MLIYANRTRFPAIVTVRVESTDNPKDALSVSSDGVADKVAATPACYDLLVSPGSELSSGANTVVVFINSRCAT